MRGAFVRAAAAAAIVCGVSALWTASRLLPAVRTARAAFEGGKVLDRDASQRALASLHEISEIVDGVAAAPLRILPVAAQNLRTLEQIAQHARPVVGTVAAAQQRAAAALERGLLAGGRVRTRRLHALADSLAPLERTVAGLGEAAADTRSGWLLPPLWTELEELQRRAGASARHLRELRRLLSGLATIFEQKQTRRYLILLLNNAELRGAGGIVSALGSMTVEEGRLRLGRFVPQEAIVRDPSVEVPSPPGFERYERYGANTTLWVNASFSPDVPDVAQVAAELYERRRGGGVDGVVVADPRGIAALLHPDTSVRVPGTDVEVAPAEIPAFIYSGAYETYEDQRDRRRALLRLGREAFGDVVDSGLTPAQLTSAGTAIAGGHLRFVLFDREVGEALAKLGVDGDINGNQHDVVLVAVQNFGGGAPQRGSKLDAWADRGVVHECRVTAEATAACSTRVTLSNRAPHGLDPYVAGRPHGLLRSLVEVYVPHEARLTAVRVGSEPARYEPGEGDGLQVVGVYVETPRGRRSEVVVSYTLPPSSDGRYTLRALPQPLARDARLEVSLTAPRGWAIHAPGGAADGRLRMRAPFTSPLWIEAGPDRRTGLAWLWTRVKSSIGALRW